MYFLPMPLVFKLFSTGKSLPLVVSEQPKEVNDADVRPGKRWMLQQADDRCVALDRTEATFSAFAEPILVFCMACVSAGMLLTLLEFAGGLFSDGFLSALFWGALGIIVGSMAFYLGRHSIRALWFSVFLRPMKQVVVFDRERGLVTLPPVSWGKPEVIEFSKLKVGYAGSSSGGPHLVAFRETGDGAVDLTLGHGVGRDWSFYVWYMDKTRSLPPGTAFDPYRERDEARRLGIWTKEFRHPAEGIGNVQPLEGPIPEDVNELLPYLGDVFVSFDEIEWVAFGGLVHHLIEHVDGLHLEVKTLGDGTLPKERTDQLHQSLMHTLLSRLPHYRFLELAFTPRPRGRMIYSRAQGGGKEQHEATVSRL